LNSNKDLVKRYHLIKRRISAYTSLRDLVNLPSKADLTGRQWNAIESQLSLVRTYLDSILAENAKRYLNQLDDPNIARRFNYFLGFMQLELAKRYDDFFDLLFDIITQRSSKIGVLLAGCEAIAYDALRRNHPLLESIEPPIVFCNRGYGAAILRQGIKLSQLCNQSDCKPWLPWGIKLSKSVQNPIPLIQIPWQKPWYGLPSLLHELGHQFIEIVGLTAELKKILFNRLNGIGVPDKLVNLFVRSVPEIASDLYSFCCVGLAQTFTTMDILSLPPSHVFRISQIDVHPPPDFRVLLSIQWSQQLWGKKISSDLEEKWLYRYPLDKLSNYQRQFFELGRKYLYFISEIMLNTKYACLNNKRITDLFEMEKISPWKLEQKALTAKSGTLDLTGISPCEQLAVFGFIRERYDFSDELIDKIMRRWLIKLAYQRDINNVKMRIEDLKP
jgi:hypothetical protein